MMTEFGKMYKCAGAELREHFSQLKIQDLETGSKSEYTSLFPSLPYIGGRKNGETINIIMGAIVIAIVRPLLQEHLSQRQIGRIIHNTFERYFQSRPSVIQLLIAKLAATRFSIRLMRRRIEKQSDAHYANDFILENIDSTGEDFDFGYNYTQCALCKIFADNDLDEYLKYVCLGDYALFRSMGVGFTRTQTIANGAEKCDFRFTRKGETPESWPPENLAEWRETS